MNYEQRYKEALKAVKELQEANLSDDGIQNWVNEKFPELRESEDDRIRKGIIRNLEYLADRAEGFVKDELKERIAWLEKQGQQKPVEWSEEDETKRNALIGLVEEIKNQPLRRLEDWDGYISWLKSLKERYTWKPTDGQMKALDSVIDEYDGYPEFDSLVSLKNDLKKL